MRKTLIFTLLGLFSALLLPQVVHAAILDQVTNRTYALTDDAVDVTETLTSTITDSRYIVPAGTDVTFLVFNPIIQDKQATERINKTIPTIKVVDKSGKAIAFTTEVNGQNLLIKIKQPQGLVYGNPQTYTVTYKSYALSSLSGAIRDLYPPSFASDFKFNDGNVTRRYNTKVIIPKKYGDVNFVIPQKPLVDKSSNWEVTFTQEELTKTTSWIQIGTTQYYQFEFHQPYVASTTLPLFHNIYTVLLPRDIVGTNNTQDVKFSEISPSPESITRDENGNLVAKFSLPANESGEIVIKGINTVKNLKGVDLAKAGKLTDLKPEMVATLTKPAQFWEVDAPEIQKVAQELKGNETNIYNLILKTYQYVVSKIDYSEVKRFGLNERQGALKTLQGGAAVCMEYSDLFIALMRAEGVPARAAFGYGYDTRVGNENDTAHQWAEVYLPGLNSWLAVDPTWGESGVEVIGGNLNHFYTYVATLDPDTPAPVSASFFGTLPSINVDKASITAVSTPDASINYMNAEALLAKYTPPSGLNQVLQSIASSITGIFATWNTLIDRFAGNTLKLTGVLKDIVKAVIYILPLLIVFLSVVAIRRRVHKQPK
jgi:transglutaminase-like putative cysteine protease